MIVTLILVKNSSQDLSPFEINVKILLELLMKIGKMPTPSEIQNCDDNYCARRTPCVDSAYH